MSAPLIGGDEVNAVVLDIGTYQAKAGYAGEDAPKFSCPTQLGVSGSGSGSGNASKDAMDIDQRQFKAGIGALETAVDGMEVVSPFKDGVLDDWEAVEALCDHLLTSQMRLNTEEHAVMLGEASHNTDSAREKMVELMFEKYNVPAVFLAKNAVLSSFAMGKPTSLVVDMGHESTVVSAVHDGFLLKKSIVKSPIAGQYLTKCMQQAIEHKKVKLRPRYSFKRVENEKTGAVTVKDVNCANVTDSFKAYHVAAICEDAKHTVCRQLSDTPFSPEDNANIPNVTYELPDGQEISIGTPRFTIPEILFKPSLAKDLKMGAHEDSLALPQIVVDSINKCDIDVRRELFNSILLTGGSSMFGSIQKRLEEDLQQLVPSMMKFKVTAQANTVERRYSAWIGGSILSSLGTFQQMWLSKAEYKEYGAGFIHKKAP